MRLTLKNGDVVEGTPAEVISFINQPKNVAKVVRTEYGDDKFYYSETKRQFLAIKDMQINHLVNATNKIYKAWVAGLNKLEPKVYVQALRVGLVDQTFVAMLKELIYRYNQGLL